MGKRAARKPPSFPEELYVVRDVDGWVVGESYKQLMNSMIPTPVCERVTVARYRFEGVDNVTLGVVRVESDGKLVMVE